MDKSNLSTWQLVNIHKIKFANQQSLYTCIACYAYLVGRLTTQLRSFHGSLSHSRRRCYGDEMRGQEHLVYDIKKRLIVKTRDYWLHAPGQLHSSVTLSLRIYMYVHLYIYVCIYMYMYIHVHVYTRTLQY